MITENADSKGLKTENGICGSKKSRFMKEQEAKG